MERCHYPTTRQMLSLPRTEAHLHLQLPMQCQSSHTASPLIPVKTKRMGDTRPPGRHLSQLGGGGERKPFTQTAYMHMEKMNEHCSWNELPTLSRSPRRREVCTMTQWGETSKPKMFVPEASIAWTLQCQKKAIKISLQSYHWYAC